MAGKITEYSNSRTTFVDGDLFDVSAFLNPGYESQKTTWLDFKNNLDSSGYLTSVALNDLTDATIATPLNGQVLAYNSTSGQWENQAAGDGIYGGSGSLGASTVVTMSGYQLDFTGSNQSPHITSAGYLRNYGKAGAATSGTVFGDNAGKSISSATFSTFFGHFAGKSVSSGSANSFFGGNAGFSASTGGFNTGLGYKALEFQTTGINNVAVGGVAGQEINSGANLTTASNSVFLGYDTRSLAIGQTNEIVVGYAARGNGSNTATWGNASITNHYFSGNVDATTYSVNGTAGANFSGAVTNITVVDGIVTSVS